MALPDETAGRDLAQAEEALRQRLLSAAARFDSSNGDHQAMVELDVALAFDPDSLVGQEVRVFWPDDEAWYLGSVVRYDSKSAEHAVHYVDGTKEAMIMAIERVRVILTVGQDLPRPSSDKLMGYASLLDARAASAEPAKVMKLRLRADQIRSFVAAPPEPRSSIDGIENSPTKYAFGDVVWGQVKGYPPWPALVVTREHVLQGQQPSENFAARIADTVPVVYFGSFERQHVRTVHVTALREGIKAGYCVAKTTKRRAFGAAICETEAWLADGELPEGMFPCNDEPLSDEEEEDPTNGGRQRPAKRQKKALSRSLASWRAKPGAIGMPMKIGSSLKVLSLGHIEWLHPGFHNEKAIWPVGYRAIRTAATPAAGEAEAQIPHLCEIIAAPDGSGPIFRVTPEGGAPVEAKTPAKAWALLFKRPRGQGNNTGRGAVSLMETSGARHFGLTTPQVVAAILGLPGAERCERFSGWPDGAAPPAAPPLTEDEIVQRLRCEAACCRLPEGVHGVPGASAPPGVCSVCFEEEEDDADLVLQCDCCGIFVHMLCYGVRKPPLGRLWLCDICRVVSDPGGGGVVSSPKPACALCPVLGGAMKRTTCGRWVHLTCALWMDGPALDRKLEHAGLEGLVAGMATVHPSRYRHTCGICRQPHGACTQCCDPSCYACFHIMCARQAGCHMHVENVHVSEDSDEDALDDGLKALDSVEESERAPSSSGQGASGDENAAAALHNTSSSVQIAIETATGEEEPPQQTKPQTKINKKKKSKSSTNNSKSARRQPVNSKAMSINGAQLLVYCTKHSPCDAQPARAPAQIDQGCHTNGHGGFERVDLAAEAGKVALQLPTVVTTDLAMRSARAASLHDRLRRGHREPEALAAALAKRRFIEAVPLLLSGSRVLGPKGETGWYFPNSRSVSLLDHSHRVVETSTANQRGVNDDPEADFVIVDGNGGHRERSETNATTSSHAGELIIVTAAAIPQEAHSKSSHGLLPVILSTIDRYHEMRRTEHQRVVPGKSAIHGWGAFARVPHCKGQMVIEYIGDLVRPSVADVRERALYDSLVGAGTYVFRLNAKECVDATRAGNLAHLLNHSCHPNCHSRTVQLWNEAKKEAVDHVVIFALRDIAAWEELTYDYRFLGEEVLGCTCGARSCRGMVNEPKCVPGREQLLVPRSQVKPYVVRREEK